MPTRPEALGDTTAWIALRHGRPAAVASVRRLLRRGPLAVCDPVALHRGGRHRGVPPMDLLIAAIAQEHDLPVLHDDAQFDLIARVTGQPMIRLG